MLVPGWCSYATNSQTETIPYDIKGQRLVSADPLHSVSPSATVKLAFEAIEEASQEMALDKSLGGWWPTQIRHYNFNENDADMQIGGDGAAGYSIYAFTDYKSGLLKVKVSVLHVYCQEGDPKPAATIFAEKIRTKLKAKHIQPL